MLLSAGNEQSMTEFMRNGGFDVLIRNMSDESRDHAQREAVSARRCPSVAAPFGTIFQQPDVRTATAGLPMGHECLAGRDRNSLQDITEHLAEMLGLGLAAFVVFEDDLISAWKSEERNVLAVADISLRGPFVAASTLKGFIAARRRTNKVGSKITRPIGCPCDQCLPLLASRAVASASRLELTGDGHISLLIVFLPNALSLLTEPSSA